MRFHFGLSFSWRTIKKFLIPFILGILAILGFNFIYDNKVPLGIIQANALENYETWYDYNYTDLSSYENYVIDSNNHTLKDFVDSIKSRNDNLLDYVIDFRINNNVIDRIYIFVFYTSTDRYYFNLFGQSNKFYFKFSYQSNFGCLYSFTIPLNTDIFSSTNYNDFITCITTNTCTRNSYFVNNYEMTTASSTIDNNSNNAFSSNRNVIYYSSKDLLVNNVYDINSNSLFYKSLRVNDRVIEVGSKFSTYLDYVNSQNQPEPEPEPTPEDTTEHKALFNKIFWFDDNSTNTGILSSIYELLFLYCLTMIIFRILTYIKNTRW